MKEWESEMIERFQRAAHHYLGPGELPSGDDTFEWLALMQHYGAPTRLLDWTRSPYVASFFALSDAVDASAVWAFDTRWCHEMARNVVEQYNDELHDEREMISWPGREMRRDYWTKEWCNEALFSRELMIILSLQPFRMNERLSIQRGLFLIPGDLRSSFMDVMRGFGDGYTTARIRKYVLPNSAREDAIYDLNQMNINRATLFPGLDGYAESLRLYPFIYQRETPLL